MNLYDYRHGSADWLSCHERPVCSPYVSSLAHCKLAHQQQTTYILLWKQPALGNKTLQHGLRDTARVKQLFGLHTTDKFVPLLLILSLSC